MGNRYPFSFGARVHRTASVQGGAGQLNITNSTQLSNGTVNSTFSATISAEGGSESYTPGFTVIGSLPAGLTLSTAGAITGTPSTTGLSTFTIHVEDSEGSTARKSFRQTVVSSAVGEHDYFDALSTRGDMYLSASLRTQADIDQYKAPFSSGNWLYDSTMDAARGVTRTSSSLDADISPQLRFQFTPNWSSGTFTVIWDSYKGTDWRDQIDPPNKMYMVRNSSGSIHFVMRFHSASQYNLTEFTPNGSTVTDAGFADIRPYKGLSTTADAEASGGWYQGATNSTKGGIRTAQGSISAQPQRQAVWIPHSEWHRHVIHCELSSATHGTDYDRWWYWVIKQGSGSTVVVEGMPMSNRGVDFFAFHFDNSSPSESSFVAWERNVWVGRGLSTSDVAGLLSTQSL